MNIEAVEDRLVTLLGQVPARFEEEVRVIGSIIHHHLMRTGNVTNKDIILSLIGLIESTTDIAQQHLLRSAMEIVVGRTYDDI